MTNPPVTEQAVERSIQHYLDHKLECFSNGDHYPPSNPANKTNGYVAAKVPDWQLRQWLTAIAALTKSPPVTVSEGRMTTFLEILSAMGGVSEASDYPGAWTNAFCEEHEGRDPDTFNQAIDAGYVDWSHDSDIDCSTIRLTDKGRAVLAMSAKEMDNDE